MQLIKEKIIKKILDEQSDYIIEAFFQEFKNNLQNFDLRLNQITEIKENSFSGSNNLQQLNFRGI